ncbi:hypothetical protein EV356DRAFT_529066 [Viridothelium virens]|uniref:DUF2423 domain-containing protein n=1 Tax=Viridothelium virens TaxID=1048519 RepID=A0A6A6HKW8_VIRVR|nr:hypothetical protein EV356DRAFT_529066 [Viridothelium virens]
MAKSLRSTRNKVNKSSLRKKVFNPVETARLERLSSKLLDLAQQPRPERTAMEVEKMAAEEKPATAENEEQMEDAEVEGEDIDMNDAQPSRAKRSQSKAEQRRKSARSHKVQKRRAKNSIVFPKSKYVGKGGGPGVRKSKRH